MILRSWKVVKVTPNSDELEEKDIISSLPIVLVIKILSLLPDADANRTRILSKRWEYFWAFLPNLHIKMDYDWSIEQLTKFYNTVDQALTLRDGMTIQKFIIRCRAYGCDFKRVYELFRKVVQCKVQEIDVSIAFEFDSFEVRSCWDLFKMCNTLVRLTLDGFNLDFPDNELHFLCLKIIKLKSNFFSSDDSFANLISGCPVLEELILEPHVLDNVHTFKVSSPSLKRLSIFLNNCIHFDEELVVDAPILEYLYILNSNFIYFLTKPLSLVEAHISLCYISIQSELVISLSSTKLLTLSDSTVKVLRSAPGLNVPVFPNLIELVVDIFCVDDWNFLLVLLNNMPNLEHITFPDGLPRCYCCPLYNVPAEAPDCIHFKMKEIIMRELTNVREDEVTFIRYLLKHAENLEILKVGLESWDLHSASIEFIDSS